MRKPTIDIITMGCSKNLVDSERLMAKLEACGFSVTHDSDTPQGEIAVINTCGFIADAKEESINTILEFAEAKKAGRLKRLYVMGCLSERYLAELEQELPEVDRYFGKFNYTELLDELSAVSLSASVAPRKLTTPGHYAYLKISEGCDRHCAYCAIPLITGHHRSRTINEILDEVRWLASQGVSEIQVIAQELTYYGIDIDGRQHIAELVEQMAGVQGIRWIRLHYAYPAHFPWELLRVIRENPKVCKYLDIALQHISDNMLTRMQRHVSSEETYELIRRIREEVPGIHLRTTLMVGFPGETDEDFSQLMEFVRRVRFERMGAFAYSEEEGTPSAINYTDDIPADVKQQRLDRLMRLQQRIASEIAEQKIGKTFLAVIDRSEKDYWIGRTEFSSPEVDPEVLIPIKEPLEVGQYYNVLITDAEEFDLYGTTQHPNRTDE